MFHAVAMKRCQAAQIVVTSAVGAPLWAFVGPGPAPCVSSQPINGRKCPPRVYKRRGGSVNRKAEVIYSTALR